MLVYHILEKAGYNVGFGGNIGKSFARQLLTADCEYYVLELSSFQLDDLVDFRADIAILLNITPDHLDRYQNDMSLYVNSKMRIINNQTNSDWFIYNADDTTIRDAMEKKKSEDERRNILSSRKPKGGRVLKQGTINNQYKKSIYYVHS
jgi:UDP-N-acetylmuramoylalanine--D-glutamate ligase